MESNQLRPTGQRIYQRSAGQAISLSKLSGWRNSRHTQTARRRRREKEASRPTRGTLLACRWQDRKARLSAPTHHVHYSPAGWAPLQLQECALCLVRLRLFEQTLGLMGDEAKSLLLSVRTKFL